jgi:inner membrane protein COX18
MRDALATYVADPSMATEGCLWFPDLTVADPLHVLPFALSAILLVNVVPRSRLAWRQFLGLDPPAVTWTGNLKWRLRIQRGLLVVAVAIGPLTIHLPAALHLYWITSATLAQVQSFIVGKFIPMPKTVRSARREGLICVMPTRSDTAKPDKKP